jgi:uncharacterized membrane protein
VFTGIQLSPWAYPALEIVHIVGIALLLGNLVLLELRVFGQGSAIPVQDLSRLGLTLVAIGFSLAALSGTLMFATQPNELLANRAFTIKLVLLFMAGINAVVFHSRKSLEKLDTTARVLMLGSTVIWLGVITCGRWIAYL